MAEISKLNIKGTNYEISDDTARSGLTNKADKTSAVSNVTYDTTNKKITKTINGTTSDVVTASQIVSDGLQIAGKDGTAVLGGIVPQSGLNLSLNPNTNIQNIIQKLQDTAETALESDTDIYRQHASEALPCITNSIYIDSMGHLIVNLGKMAYAYIDSSSGEMGVGYAYMNTIIYNTNLLEQALGSIINYTSNNYFKSSYMSQFIRDVHNNNNFSSYIDAMYALIDIALAKIEALESYSYGYSYSYSY